MLNFLSYWFGIETTSTLIHNRSSLVNHTRFQRKMGEISCFQTKTAQTPPGGAHTYMAYIREYPPGQWGWFCSLLAIPHKNTRKLNENCSETLQESRIAFITFLEGPGHFSGPRIKVSIVLKMTHWKYKLTKKSWPVWELCTTIQ